MAKASKKRGTKKAAKGTKKKTKARKPAAKRSPAKRKSSKRPPAKKSPAKRKPAKKSPAKRKPEPQTEPWPMIFVVLLAVAAAVMAGWHFNGVAEAAAVGGAAIEMGVQTAAAVCGYPDVQPSIASAVSLPDLR